MTARSALAASVALMAAVGPAWAADRSQYSLVNPTPGHLLREMTTDRPDITEVPFTIDPGRVQIEASVFNYARFRDPGGAVSHSYDFMVTNVRIGLTPNFEAGFVLQPYGMVRVKQGGVPTLRYFGIGGLQLRSKYNFWGNDTFDKPGATALAILPFVTLPTDDDNGISAAFTEAGFNVPFAVQLSQKLSLGINGGTSWVRGDAGSGYHPEYTASASFGYDWTDVVGTYVELAGRFNTDDPRGDPMSFGVGITYAVTKNLQLDAGVNVGLTSAADQINPFVGFSARF
jgi:opacity protein-like surface antigen